MPINDDILAGLPPTPGVYLMKDGNGRVIYVGKAVNLRNRVRSYFRDSGDGRFFVPFLRSRVHDVEVVMTDTEKEALLLENTLIKKHKPRYNIRLRDDKTYISVRLDIGHRWPRVHRTRKIRRGDKALYFGPYSSAASVKETLRFLQRLFPLRSCSDRELENRARPCVLHQIDRCCAPCVKDVDPGVYAGYVQGARRFLEGKREDVIALLESRMQEHSEQLEFEKAAVILDRIRAMQRTIEEEKVHSHRAFDRDVVAFARGGGKAVFVVHCYRGGRLDEQVSFKLADVNLEDATALEGFLSQYYDTTRDTPRDILLPCEPDNRELLAEGLMQQRGGPVRVASPQRGRKRRLVEMAGQNAQDILNRVLAGHKTVAETLEALRAALRLATRPRWMECVDISNFQGSFSVGSLTCFRDGEPDKSGYRRFRIRSVEGQNDFAMMREVLSRRYRRLAAGEEDAPDLLVIDGGVGQLNAALAALEEIGVAGRFAVVGMAKSRLKMRPGPVRADDKYRTEERIFLPNRKNPVTFERNDPALHLLERLRDETHRFAIEYHRLLRSKAALKSGLEEIPGMGPKRRAALLKHFGSLARIKAASREELAAAPGLPATVADTVYDFLHQGADGGIQRGAAGGKESFS